MSRAGPSHYDRPMRPARRRALIAVAVLLPATLVYGGRQLVAPDAPFAGTVVEAAPVFVGRVTPAGSFASPGRPLRVTVEISADRRVDLAGIRMWTGDGAPDEIIPFTVGTEVQTVPFEVAFSRVGDHALVLQVRLTGDSQWSSLPPAAKIIVG